MVSTRIMVERGVVGFGLDYTCVHIIILASVNLLPIQADFVTERVKQFTQLVTLKLHSGHLFVTLSYFQVT